MPQISSLILLAIHSHLILPHLASCHHSTKDTKTFAIPSHPIKVFCNVSPRVVCRRVITSSCSFLLRLVPNQFIFRLLCPNTCFFKSHPKFFRHLTLTFFGLHFTASPHPVFSVQVRASPVHHPSVVSHFVSRVSSSPPPSSSPIASRPVTPSFATQHHSCHFLFLSQNIAQSHSFPSRLVVNFEPNRNSTLCKRITIWDFVVSREGVQHQRVFRKIVPKLNFFAKTRDSQFNKTTCRRKFRNDTKSFSCQFKAGHHWHFGIHFENSNAIWFYLCSNWVPQKQSRTCTELWIQFLWRFSCDANYASRAPRWICDFSSVSSSIRVCRQSTGGGERRLAAGVRSSVFLVMCTRSARPEEDGRGREELAVPLSFQQILDLVHLGKMQILAANNHQGVIV